MLCSGKWLWRFPIERESFGEESLLVNLGRYKVGGPLERRTRFWWDMWVGDSKLKDLFPLLFRIAANNSAIVADLWGRQEGGVRVQEGEDFWFGKLRRKGTFKVNSYYRSLKEDNSPLFPEKEVWGSYAPLRTRFFAWEAVWDKISTIDMLMRRGWSMANRCNLCKENEETANHILIHCVRQGILELIVFFVWGGVGAPGFREKFAS
ncbi:hypothetical protein CK203_101404 [Vitis vinifera]|uniref:Reverse transcriptase zinc-binding domain-containing protein n=1 Tax=Vitis vinifera TaxID=29760 RepID=A0A438F1E8_VITVI|nr:hypothetical protein CK203_101404 [Vitis vinifera]